MDVKNFTFVVSKRLRKRVEVNDLKLELSKLEAPVYVRKSNVSKNKDTFE